MLLPNILLQADPVISTAAQLTSYGPIGLIAFLFSGVIIYQEKIRRDAEAKTTKRMQEQDDKIAKLEDRIDKYQNEDRTRMLEVIQHNTDIMEEVVGILQKTKNS